MRTGTDSPRVVYLARRAGFTLVEMLVVLSIITLLMALLLPAVQRARHVAQSVACMSNVRQLAAATMMYTMNNEGSFPPLYSNAGPNYYYRTWRHFILPNTGWSYKLYNCPSSDHKYSTGARFDGTLHSTEQIVRGGGGVTNEWRLDGGYGAVNIHWKPNGTTSVFARGPYDPIVKGSSIKLPSRTIMFADGYTTTASGYYWWIWSDVYAGNQAGFNRAEEDIMGWDRHMGQANYAFADGHVETLHPDEIKCTENACWWSVEVDPHDPH